MISSPALITHDLSIGYRNRTVAHEINVSLHQGELVCLIGPNGVGKSTLMRTLAGMQQSLEGAVLLQGLDLHQMNPRQLARRLSIVLTQRADIGLMTGYALVALGRHPYTDWTGQLSRNDEAVIRWAVDAVGANEIAARPVDELSDGERQKLMIARALAQEPDVMLLDEPTAFLDLPRRVEIMLLLRRLSRETNRAILLSTHDLDLALRNADRIWLMARDLPICVGSPEDLILEGAFENAFSTSGIRFDSQSGSFVADTEPTHEIQVQGDGIRTMWTKRALERIDYRISETSKRRVIVEEARWLLHQPDQPVQICNSVQELLTLLSEESL